MTPDPTPIDGLASGSDSVCVGTEESAEEFVFYKHDQGGLCEPSDVSWDSEAELSDLEPFPQAEIDAQIDNSSDDERPWIEVAMARRREDRVCQYDI